MRSVERPARLRLGRRGLTLLFLVTGALSASASFPLILALCGDPAQEARVAQLAGVLFLLSGGLVGGAVLTAIGTPRGAAEWTLLVALVPFALAAAVTVTLVTAFTWISLAFARCDGYLSFY